jgi:hypothetical protein
MMKKLTIALLLAAALPATAQNWSVGARTGAFVFGDLLERRVQPISGDTGADPTILTLTAETAPGVAFDLERRLADRWAVRFEGTFSRAPLALRDPSNDEGDIRSGDLDVTTFTVPLVFRINTGGSFRFHLLGGPAYVLYVFKPDNAAGIPVPDDSRAEWGVQVGGGVTWHVSERFGVEGSISDVATRSPIDRTDLPDIPGFKIPRPHNIHTTVGIRYRF